MIWGLVCRGSGLVSGISGKKIRLSHSQFESFRQQCNRCHTVTQAVLTSEQMS